jgi:hypothetical protein
MHVEQLAYICQRQNFEDSWGDMTQFQVTSSRVRLAEQPNKRSKARAINESDSTEMQDNVAVVREY